MAQFNQLGRTPGIELPVKNYGVTAIAEKLAVIRDTANPPGPDGVAMGVTLPASDAGAFGILTSPIAVGGYANVQLTGVARCVAGAAIALGQVVMTNSAGKIVPQTAGLYQIGTAMSVATAINEDVLVFLHQAKNA